MMKRSSDFVINRVLGLQAHEMASEIAEMAINHPQTLHQALKPRFMAKLLSRETPATVKLCTNGYKSEMRRTQASRVGTRETGVNDSPSKIRKQYNKNLLTGAGFEPAPLSRLENPSVNIIILRQ